jgi:hypothetical protein
MSNEVLGSIKESPRKNIKNIAEIEGSDKNSSEWASRPVSPLVNKIKTGNVKLNMKMFKPST